MPKKKKILKPDTGPKLPVGSFALVVRPHLWHGFHCLIEAHRETCHLCRVTRIDGTSFLIAAKSDELKAV